MLRALRSRRRQSCAAQTETARTAGADLSWLVREAWSRRGRAAQSPRAGLAFSEALEPRRLFAAGDLDPSFSGDGRQTLDLGARGAALDVVVQSNGKVVIAGQADSASGATSDAILARFNVDGSLDTTFGSGGIARIDFGGSERFNELVIMPDGKLVAGGQQTATRWMLARFTADGIRDAGSSFGGTDGVQVGDGQITNVALQGSAIITSDGNNVVRRHVGSTGALDTTFGSGGSVVVSNAIPTLAEFRRLADVAVQNDGRIVVVGVASGDPNDESDNGAGAVYGIGRLNANGIADSSFGAAGGVRLGLDIEASSASAVAVRGSDGAIFVAGTDAGEDANLVQLDSSGAVDQIVSLPSTGSDVMSTSDILFDAQGKVLVAGQLGNDDNESLDFLVVRLLPTLDRDITFSADGQAYIDFPTANPDDPFGRDFLTGAALDSQGRIVLSGSSGVPNGIAVARLETPADTAVTFFRDTGELVIDGTSSADTIALTTSGGTLTVTRNGAATQFANGSVTSITISGLAGNDTLTLDAGVVAPALINGGAGADSIRGGSGDDTVLGGAGVDPDTLAGGAGTDQVSYEDRSDDVNVSLDGVANDGAAGENDSVAADIENVRGGSGADHITGNDGVNVLEGFRFDSGIGDTLVGLGANDSLRGAARGDGGAGDDSFFGVDIIDYASRTANLSFQVGSNIFGGAAGENDVIAEDFNRTILQLGSGNDTVRLASAFASSIQVRGGPGADLIDMRRPGTQQVNRDFALFGEAGNDTIFGSDGSDTINGGTGTDSLDGGPGLNVLDYSERTTGVNVSLDGIANDGAAGENDTVLNVHDVVGGSGDDVLSGDDASQTIVGNGGNDTIRGLGGNDWLDGNDGNDSLEGGEGNDTLDGAAGTDFGDGGAGTNSLISIETTPGGTDPTTPSIAITGGVLVGRGTGGNDTITIRRVLTDDVVVTINGTSKQFDMDDFAGGVRLEGLGGADRITVTDSLNTPVARRATLDGGNGNDTLTGNDGADLLLGGEGDDSLVGKAGNDTLNGGNGTDFADGDGGANTHVSIEQFAGGAASISILSRVLTATGTANADTITIERSGTDDVIVKVGTLSKQFDMDDFDTVLLQGMGGNDVLTIKQPITAGSITRKVTLDGGAGNDSLTGNAGDDVLRGGDGDDTLIGLGGRDALSGQVGNDQLFGGLGLDFLDGGDNDDFIDSSDSAGGDTVLGGTGADTAKVDTGDQVSGVETLT